MEARPSDGLEAIAAATAAIEDAGHAIEDLDVQLVGNTPKGRLQVTVALVDAVPASVQLDPERVEIVDNQICVDLGVTIDQADDADDRSTDESPSPASPERSQTETDLATETDSATEDPNESDSTADIPDAAASNPVSMSADSDSVPVYRDPDRLAAVYDPEATFAEMTEELGVDVTAQTVRKYMIVHGIHDPAPRQSESGEDGGNDEPETQIAEQTDPIEANGSGLDEEADSDQDGDHEPAESNADRSEASAEADKSHTARGTVPPTRLPEGVTVEDFVEVLTKSRTVYEVQRGLELDGKQTRSLLHRLNLIDLVTGRINKGETPPTKEQVLSRLADGDRGPDQAEV